MHIFEQYLITFGWALTGAISMGIALGIGLKIYNWITPIDEWKEIKEKNMGVAMIVSSVIISFGIVIGLTIN